MFTLAGGAAFLAGLVLPFVQVAPGERLGPVSGFVVWLISDDDTYSLLGSILAIWEDHQVLGGIAFAFSLVLPTLKLLVLSYCSLLVARDAERTAFYRTWAERLGPWSMLEVFLVALTLLLSKSLPFGTVIHPLAGFYCFWASILLSLLAAWTLPREPRPARQVNSSPVGTPKSLSDDAAAPNQALQQTGAACSLSGVQRSLGGPGC